MKILFFYRKDKTKSFQVWKLVIRHGMPFLDWWPTSSAFFLSEKLLQRGVLEKSSMICCQLCIIFFFYFTQEKGGLDQMISRGLFQTQLFCESLKINFLFCITLNKKQILCAQFLILCTAVLGCVLDWSSSWWVCWSCAQVFDVDGGASAEMFWLGNAEFHPWQK